MHSVASTRWKQRDFKIIIILNYIVYLIFQKIKNITKNILFYFIFFLTRYKTYSAKFYKMFK